ncbi:hypothetical protein ACF0H5_022334 [Mactra antiquata]
MDGRARRARERLKRSDYSVDEDDIDLITSEIKCDLKFNYEDACSGKRGTLDAQQSFSVEDNELVFSPCDEPLFEKKVEVKGERKSGFLIVTNQANEDESGNKRKGIVCGKNDVDKSLKRLSNSFQKQERFSRIKHRFESVHEVREAMVASGITECNLIVGVDYTPSNMIRGQKTFGGRSLHDLSPNVVNPYKEVICIFGETLEDLKTDDAEIHVFGFGKKLFPMKSQKKCVDFNDVIKMYESLTPNVKFCGPTDFSLIIYESIKIVERTEKFHILLIIADGQVTDEEKTKEALMDASNYALSVVVVGVGDGPWDAMYNFYDNLPDRKFDNFQFVEFYSIKETARNPEAELALMALMEVPEQFKAISAMHLLD